MVGGGTQGIPGGSGRREKGLGRGHWEVLEG